MKTLIIIPSYNEEKNIVNTVNEIKNDFDYIVINDGSTDNTKKILKENNINHINLIQNLGIGGAMETGYKYAFYNNYDIAIQFDGDGQHNKDYINDLIKPILNNEVDLVIGSRYIKGKEAKFQSTFLRRLGKNIISFIIKILTNKKITDPTSGFRAANKNVIKIFKNNYLTEYPEPSSTLLLLRNKYKIKEIPVEMNERILGKSSIGSFKSIYFMINVILALLLNSRRIQK